ncbi:dTDP-4-dehydrorhamnose reductase [Oerskovia turbata]|uniref:dTDP-4-dehydrorhamnose reductase n=1 Tax=Oerskovia turbata TaxID=1713 RepID=A0A4Q1KVS2_9CELL|nr:dTDP-4-dehydrorhamnose reductase [Oerskovia turbata]RXR26714.1 dTDP-4-dehydrorhamnose reductase [Oerskovia turbata]RXR34411.1 dTDP-4-dehydrorhamnose reductase [Oerskovia turbata]TGJ97724.1 dTDP-4-dehydrorhamnose reductase [Actinotalea fermentans ATCC 43279 = JCM 9966 = DSM 3133]
MRWVVTGAGGMLGAEVVELLAAREQDVVVALSRDRLDVTDPDAVLLALRGADVVVNCAAFTAVDDAESDEACAAEVNSLAPRLLAAAAREVGARLVHVSTDYVFGASDPSDGPIPTSAPTAPRSAYGRTKEAGERAVRAELEDHLIVRTAWLYGAKGGCFPRTIAALAAQREHVDVVDDQVGQPTWAKDLAELLVRLVDAGVPPGTYHGTASGKASWFEFAREVVRSAHLPAERVGPCASTAFPRPAPRPAWSVLAHDALRRAGVAPIGDWRERWRAAADEVLSGP